MSIQDDKSMPKSRVTLRYRTEINGVPEDITLPLRILVAGDFSGYGPQGNTRAGERDVDDKNKRVSLDKRHIFDASQILDSEEVRSLSGTDHVNPIMKLLNINLEGKEFNSIDDFLPDRIIENSAPEVKQKLEIRRLLTEVTSNLSNNKRYLKAMENMLSNTENGKDSPLQEALKETLKSYAEIN